ncbi:MAG: electron transfer flavoprotein subunit alpha/FixB family protein [Kouleothrix sp.]|nr:electron transfer flavoprotein subunit alpha/FixB family protein [Kouleothrix sp.]
MIIVLIEHDRGRLSALSLEALTFGRDLAGRLDVPLHAALVGEAARPLADGLGEYGVATAHLALHDRLDDYAPEAWAQSLVELIAAQNPAVVLAAGSDRGNEVMAHVAARRGLPLAANCVAAHPGEQLEVTRLRWGGSLLEQARLHGAVRLLTIAPHALAAEPGPAAGEVAVEDFTPALAEKEFRVRVVGRVEAPEGAISLADARVVVGGGRGVGSSEGFGVLEELAGLLGAAVGCSRAVTSQGWRPHADQIGQTGTRIAPELYIACGVSGAIQHMVGCKGSRHILAINTDPEAPIVANADYAIVGDLHKVIPALCAEIRKGRGQ